MGRSEESLLQELFKNIEIGDSTPSQFLCHMNFITKRTKSDIDFWGQNLINVQNKITNIVIQSFLFSCKGNDQYQISI